MLQSITLYSFLYIESRDKSLCSSMQKQQNVKKMPRHEANVTTAGGLFYPLVFESLGFISSFTPKTLKGVRSKTSSIRGMPFPRAFKNILEKLSVKVWCYNAKMLHARVQMRSFRCS